MNLLGVELKRVLGEFETFLDESSEFTDAATLLTKDFLGVGSTDDDLKENIKIRSQRRLQHWIAHFSSGVGDTDIAARVTLFGQFTGEEFIEFSAENTIRDKLSFFADLSGHCV